MKAGPHAGGYLRSKEGHRLFGQRDELCRQLTAEVTNNREWLLESLQYPVAWVK